MIVNHITSRSDKDITLKLTALKLPIVLHKQIHKQEHDLIQKLHIDQTRVSKATEV